MTTSNLALYGETGRYHVIIHRKLRILKYWFKLMNSFNTNQLLYTLYIEMLKECENGKTNWLTNVKILLQESGYPDVWLFRNSIINIPYFLELVKIRLKDTVYTLHNGEKACEVRVH
jgi:hypothetical protein